VCKPDGRLTAISAPRGAEMKYRRVIKAIAPCYPHSPALSIEEAIDISKSSRAFAASAYAPQRQAARSPEPEAIMSRGQQECILLVDNNQVFREALAQRLRAAGHEVVAEDTGERAFPLVRNWNRSIGWLYARAALPRLVDGWILADAYHEVHARRPVVIAAAEARASECDIVLAQPSPGAVAKALLVAIADERAAAPEREDDAMDKRRAA
jgi:CheY-like chemotaxis protein